jgi:hypothetical protein
MSPNGTATYQPAGSVYVLRLDEHATWRYTDVNGKEWTLSKHTGEWRKFEPGLDGTLWTWSERAQDWLYTGKPFGWPAEHIASSFRI